MRIILGCILVLGVSVFSFSQEKLSYKTNVEIGGGLNQFSGDVCETCSSFGYGLEVSSRFLLGNKFFFKPAINFNHLNSTGSVSDGLKFKNNTFGLNLVMEYGLHKLSSSSFSGRMSREVYLHGGVGGIHSNPYSVIGTKKIYLAPLQTEGISYGKFLTVLNAGINFNFKINKSGRLGAKFDVNYTFSDYLDNVSKELDSTVEENSSITELGILTSASGKYKVNSGNDLFFRLLLTYEFQIKTKHNDSVEF